MAALGAAGNDVFMEVAKDDAPRDQLALQLFRLLDQTPLSIEENAEPTNRPEPASARTPELQTRERDFGEHRCKPIFDALRSPRP